MNTTPPPALPPEILLWPIDNIVPSPFQERKHFDPQPMQELADSIRINGIIQPLTVRRVAADQPLELVCGERRLRGGKMAELKEVPVILRELSDAQAENIVLTENIQREDLTPSEEARSYERLLKLRDESGKLMHTRDSVAKLASKTTNHIDDHLKLLACPKELMEAVDSGTVALSVAMVVGRIPDPKLRPAAAAKVLKPEYQQVPMNFIQARELVRQEFMVSLAKVPWSLSEADLVPEKQEEVDGVMTRCFGGDCESCPFRSGNLEGASLKAVVRNSGPRKGFEQTTGAAANLCTLPKCHKAKLDAVWAKQKRQAMMDGLKVLDDAEAKKAFHPSRQEIANGSKYVWLDAKPEYHEVGHLSYSAGGRIWRSLLKGSEIPVIVARQPHTGLRVEVALAKDAKPVGEKALRAKKPSEAQQAEKSPAELKAEAEAKERRKKELRQQKIDKIALDEGVREIREAITSGRVKADERFQMALFTTALGNAGSDGLKFMAAAIELDRDKKASSYDLEKPLKKWVAENCATAPQMMAMTVLALLAKSLHWNGAKDPDFQSFLGLCGLKQNELERRAKALLDGEEKAKMPKDKHAPKSGTKENWSTEQVNETVAAADAVAKGKVLRPERGDGPIMTAAKLGIKAGEPGPEWLEAFNGDKGPGMMARGPRGKGTSANAKDYAAAAAKKGKPAKEDWKAVANAGEFDAQVTKAKAGVPWSEIIGPMPAEGTKQRKVWDALRVRIYKAAKKAKGAK